MTEKIENIVVENRKIPYSHSLVSVNECLLDPKNPRIQFLVGQRATEMTQEELDAIIWDKEAVKSLAQSIFQNGGVFERIIVQRTNGNFLVREGNCRTVACRHLMSTHKGDIRFETMPAMVFLEELTEEDLAILLADMHVASKIRWDAFEQAKHVHDLYHIYGKTYEWLGNHLRLSKGKISELIEAYKATDEYLLTRPAPVNIRKFSFFQELMKKKDLKQKFQTSPEWKQQFHKWIETGKLTDAKQVRDLQMILGSLEAREALDNEGAEEAAKVLRRNDPALESELFAIVKKATDVLNRAPANEVQELGPQGNPQKIVLLRNLKNSIENLFLLAGSTNNQK